MAVFLPRLLDKDVNSSRIVADLSVNNSPEDVTVTPPSVY